MTRRILILVHPDSYDEKIVRTTEISDIQLYWWSVPIPDIVRIYDLDNILKLPNKKIVKQIKKVLKIK